MLVSLVEQATVLNKNAMARMAIRFGEATLRPSLEDKRQLLAGKLQVKRLFSQLRKYRFCVSLPLRAAQLNLQRNLGQAASAPPPEKRTAIVIIHVRKLFALIPTHTTTPRVK